MTAPWEDPDMGLPLGDHPSTATVEPRKRKRLFLIDQDSGQICCLSCGEKSRSNPSNLEAQIFTDDHRQCSAKAVAEAGVRP